MSDVSEAIELLEQVSRLILAIYERNDNNEELGHVMCDISMAQDLLGDFE